MDGRTDGGDGRHAAEGPEAGPVGARDAGSGSGQDAGRREDEALLARTRAVPVLAGPLPHLDPERVPDAPGPLFAEWLAAAIDAGVPEPQVMTLSTAAPDGTPSARVLILRGIDSAGCAYDFASDSRTRKGRDLAANPRAALTWYWPALGRQIRMAGPVVVLGPDATARDFLGRGEHARAAAFAGPPSAPLDSAARYVEALRVARDLVAAEPDRVPATHTLYRLRADEAEFWQADPARFHVRVRYGRQPGGRGWSRTLLWP
ncbi:putative pyridoxamine 5'-phosphate oxidase [Actinacidiphila reveromycinica]|uniref:Putative pyridoxamine 5'-phosphate oxidase n=1 Tax=Actinacidiphila reveromycinica TaxID=659352 RepID=A0A7U3UZX2_9ACTN|nr:pyridoxamine 5'-phosphate oxidase family protein [Streptomyces sp. SN-593]BBB01813.1 putative pyridoxamine 5'-phosphate oxidase [Streptomyces sp. SN-593]